MKGFGNNPLSGVHCGRPKITNRQYGRQNTKYQIPILKTECQNNETEDVDDDDYNDNRDEKCEMCFDFGKKLPLVYSISRAILKASVRKLH